MKVSLVAVSAVALSVAAPASAADFVSFTYYATASGIDMWYPNQSEIINGYTTVTAVVNLTECGAGDPRDCTSANGRTYIGESNQMTNSSVTASNDRITVGYSQDGPTRTNLSATGIFSEAVGRLSDPVPSFVSGTFNYSNVGIRAATYLSGSIYAVSVTRFSSDTARGGIYLGEIVNVGVPEPATWAMMISGFGLVGGSMRRKSLSAAFA